MSNYCDYKLNYIEDSGNTVTVEAYFNEGDYQTINGKQEYIRTARINDGVLVTLFYDFNPVSMERIKEDLYDALNENKGNRTIIPECII